MICLVFTYSGLSHFAKLFIYLFIFLPSYLISGTRSVVPGPAAWTLPRSLEEMQAPRLTVDQHFKQDPWVIHDHIQV